MSFNDSQNSAISHLNGPMQVLAGPGSGKTFVITRRAKKLIEEYGINPSNILVITFTKAAALEMEERFTKLNNGQKLPVIFGTFHAVYFKILKYAYNYSTNNILGEDIKREYIKEIIEKMDLEIDDENDFIQNIISEISLVKGDMINLEHYYSKNCSEEIFKKIYMAYESRLTRSSLIDFDDMLILCHQLLTARKDILSIWQKKYQYILIDEFQDINKVQYEIIKMIAAPLNNLFIVGDDDQSIYRFRGAKPEIMLNFEKDYPDVERLILNTNYRSTNEIIGASMNLIHNNKIRFKKEIRGLEVQGEMVDIQQFATQRDENAKIVEVIKNYIEAGTAPGEISILYRTNTGARSLVINLMENNIPFHVKDSLPNIYEHWIAKNIITYINIALGDGSRASFLKIMNKPKRYISRESLNKPKVDFEELKSFYSDKAWMIERIEKLEFDLKMLAKMNPFSAVNYIRRGIGYDEYLKEYAQYRRLNFEELMDTLDEIHESSKEYKTYEDWFHHMEQYSEELKKNQGAKHHYHDSATISTMHSAKGLEYRVVFIPDANEGITPHNKALTDEDLEEERRLFYVALTRAKERVHIYSVKELHNKEQKTSRFVGEVLCDFGNLKAGDSVHHRKYGPGSIKKYTEGKLEIYFPSLKKTLIFDAKYAVANEIIEVRSKK